MVDLCGEAVVGDENQGFNLVVVSLKEFLDGLRSVCVKGGEGVFEAQFLLEDPGQSALLDEDAG